MGKTLCTELLRQGQSVRAAMRSAKSPIDNIEVAIVGQIDGETVWEEALRGVETIIHLAARVHVMNEPAADPLAEYLRVNLHGTANLAQQAVHAGVRRLVYVSTIGVNGNQTLEAQAFTEKDTPHPHNVYAFSKWQAEQALWEIAQQTGLEVVVVRPPLVYGPAAKGNFPRLLAAIYKGIPLPLKGANNARSLIYVGNLVDALIVCATHPAAAERTYLVSDGEDVSVAILIEKISQALHRNNRSFYLPPILIRVAAEMLGRSEQAASVFGSLRVNSEKIRNELGWIPPYTLEQGLCATVDWYVSHAPE